MKVILKSIAAIVLVLVVLLLIHPLWIGPVVRTAVSSFAPKFLGVSAHLDAFALNVYTGRLTLEGFALDNPPGCGQEKFVTIGHLCVDVDPMSVLSDPIIVEEISLSDFYLSLMADKTGVYNFTTVAETAGGNKTSEDEAFAEPAQENAAAAVEEDASPKVVIDLIQVKNALVQWERVSLPLPSFRMTGLGRGSNGVTFEAAWKEMETKFIAQLGPLAQGLQSALGSVNGSFKTGQQALRNFSDSVKNIEVVGQSVKVLDGGVRVIDDSTQTGGKVFDEGVKVLDEGAKMLKSFLGK